MTRLLTLVVLTLAVLACADEPQSPATMNLPPDMNCKKYGIPGEWPNNFLVCDEPQATCYVFIGPNKGGVSCLPKVKP